jgi:hypothetical protein
MCPDDGDACNGVELCDPDSNTCFHSDAPVCDDGLVCNGLETCDRELGCVPGELVVCNAPGEACDESTGGCVCGEPFLLPDCNVKMHLFALSARDVAIEGDGVWLATERGVDYVDTRGTPFEPQDDLWAHVDERDVPGLVSLQGALVGPTGIKYFWGQNRVFAFDDGGSPLDESDDTWVGHDTEPLWVAGVLDPQGRLLIVARTMQEPLSTARVVVFDPGGSPVDASDDVVTTIDSGRPGVGRNMTIDRAGEIWLGTEAPDNGGNLFHWDRRGTPLDGGDDVWTPMRAEEGRVWKLEADPTGGVWGTVAAGVFHFFDGGTPVNLGDDYWHVYPELGSAMDIGPDGVGWFRMSAGAGVLDVGGTPRNPGDDVARLLLSPDTLRFQSNLYTNGTIDDRGLFWVVDEYVQVFEFVD